MKLKEITFTLENCETITVDGKYVGHFIIDNIEKGFYRIAVNCIKKTQNANRVVLEIHKNANREEHIFGSENLDKQFIFNRLKYGDITYVDFIIEDGDGCMEYSFAVDWCGESEYINEAQKTYESECGHLYLVIEDGKTIDDYFDKEKNNEPSYMDFRFDMMDVG